MSPRAAGLAALCVAAVADLGHKYWMLYIYEIGVRQPVRVAPFLDLVLVWNPGVSYSLLRTETPAGRWALLAFIAVAILVLSVMLWRAGNRWTGIGLGLVVGGALGNAIDRLVHGAVADFFHLFLDTQRWGRLSWYVFNIADVAIVAGVALLLYEAFFVTEKAPAAGENASSSPPEDGPATKLPEKGPK